MENLLNYFRDEYYSSPKKNLGYSYAIVGLIVFIVILAVMAIATSIPSYLSITGPFPLILSTIGGGYLSYIIISKINLNNHITVVKPGTKAILMEFKEPTDNVLAAGKYILLPGIHSIEVVEVLKSSIIYDNLSSPAQDGPNIVLPQFSTVFEFLAEPDILNVNLENLKDHILVLMAENIREIIGYNLNENLIIGENIQSKNRTSKYIHKFIDRIDNSIKTELLKSVNSNKYLSSTEKFFEKHKDSLQKLYENRAGYMHLANKTLLEQNPDVMKQSNYSFELTKKYKEIKDSPDQFDTAFQIELLDIQEVVISMFRGVDMRAVTYFSETPLDVVDIIGGAELIGIYKQFPIKFLSFSKGSFNLSKEVTDAKEAAVIADLKAEGKNKDAKNIIDRIKKSAEEIMGKKTNISYQEALEEAQRIIMASEGHETVNRVYSKGASELLSAAVLSGFSKK